MKKKIKLMMAALLGFSTACSTVKNAPQENNDANIQETQGQVERIRLMYGTPSPRPVVVEQGELGKLDTTEADSTKQINATLETPATKKE